MEQSVESEFKIISGSGNVILVAPHGVTGDDDNTGTLARKLAEKLNCHAIINEVYRKPDKDSKELHDIKKKIVNLNDLRQYRNTPLENQFLGPIKDAVNATQTNHKTTYIFHIHGIDDANIDKDYDLLVGIGKDPAGKTDRLTVKEDIANIFVVALNSVGISTQITHEDYAGWAEHNLNQLFQKESGVNSIQIEIKYTDFREKENIDTTASMIATAIREIPEIKTNNTDGTGKIAINNIKLPPFDIHTRYVDIKNILLITPDKYRDDLNNLILEIKKNLPVDLNCKIIVNKIDSEKENKKNNIDWTSSKDAERHLKDELIKPLKEFLGLGGKKLIVWVGRMTTDEIMRDHYPGISWDQLLLEDKAKYISKNKCNGIVGTGGGNGRNRTILYTNTQGFIHRALSKSGKELVFSYAKSNILAGNLKNHINQWAVNNAYLLPEVQSFTLFLSSKGVMDTPDNIRLSGKALAESFAEICMPEKEEMAIDDKLVENASEKLKSIFSKGLEQAMLTAGQYLIDNFFANNLELARTNQPRKDKSLLQLIQNLKKGDPNSPSQAWLYRSIQLVVEHNDIEKKFPELFSTYRNLLLSHKVLLFPIKDELKQQLISETHSMNYTVSELRQRLRDLDSENEIEQNPLSLLSLVRKPKLLFNIENEAFLSQENIAVLPKKTKEKIHKIAISMVDTINSHIKEQNELAEKYKDLLKKLNEQKAN